MKAVTRSFRPPPWAWLLVVAALVLFTSLGNWQVRRAQDKQAMIKELSEPGPVLLELRAGSIAPEGLLRARAWGRFDSSRQLLQEGPPRDGKPGFQVWTPLKMDDGGLLLVNRGWIAQPAVRESVIVPSAPEGTFAVHGWWRQLPEPGLRLGGADCVRAQAFPAAVVYPKLEQVECLLGEVIVPGLLLMDAAEPGGFIREWGALGFPPERHFGYAVTWYGLGLTALVLFVKLNLRKK